MRSDVLTADAPVRADKSAQLCDVRVLRSGAVAEFYITARPAPGPLARQAQDLYAAVAGVLRAADAAIVGERLFASSDAFATALRARAQSFGELDDGVRPTLLSDAGGERGAVVGVQVHAIRGVGKPMIVKSGDVPLARAFTAGGRHYLSGYGLTSAHAGDGAAQTLAVFDRMAELLASAGGSLLDVARTWIWMHDVLSWYTDLNRVRTQFFADHGLLGARGRMPASTGIGISPAGARIALDFLAAWGMPDTVAKVDAVGNQRSAYAYGSAFARAARVRTPAGSTIFCSGTAAIDASGATRHIGDVGKQVAMTLDNTAAVLRDMGCGDDDVVQAMAYCATPAVAAHFTSRHLPRLPWPCLVTIGDVCRSELLFEVELTACPEARGQ